MAVDRFFGDAPDLGDFVSNYRPHGERLSIDEQLEVQAAIKDFIEMWKEKIERNDGEESHDR